MSVLRHALDDAGRPYPETDYYCTRVISKLVWPQHPTYALDHIAQAIGITFKHHDAEEDARACALIALAACRQVSVPSLHDLQEPFGLRVGQMFSTGYRPCGGAYAPQSNTDHRRKLSAADIIPIGAAPSALSPCYGMSFVFTGTLTSMQRKDAMQAVVDCGGICHDTVKADTDFLVLGQKGFIGYQAGHKSSKMRKAEDMRSKGLPIEIISEVDFLGLL
jgi:DNA polymerase-3 subunit epsilon